MKAAPDSSEEEEEEDNEYDYTDKFIVREDEEEEEGEGSEGSEAERRRKRHKRRRDDFRLEEEDYELLEENQVCYLNSLAPYKQEPGMKPT
jgi:transcription elongation factor SPT6